MNRLDIYDMRPAGMDKYLSLYGWHFSKAACEWAVSMMRDRVGQHITPKRKEEVELMLSQFGIRVESRGYDVLYAYYMLYADFFGGAVTSDQQIAKMINDIFNDSDGYDGMLFTRWYADMIATGTPIIWEDIL